MAKSPIGLLVTAICIGFKEFQLLDYGDRHLETDPANVARRTLRAILDYYTEHRELRGSGRQGVPPPA